MITQTYANSLLDVYTTTGVTTYEVTATAEVDVPTQPPWLHWSNRSPTGRKGGTKNL